MVSSPFRDPRAECWLLAFYVTTVISVTVQRGIFGFPNDYAIFRTYSGLPSICPDASHLNNRDELLDGHIGTLLCFSP